MAVGILFVSDVYFPRVNGVSTSIQTFRRDLAAQGCETWLVAPSYPDAWQDDPGILRQPSRYLVFDPEDRMMHGRAARRAGLALRARKDIPADRPMMLLVGRVAHEKNIGFLLRVLDTVRAAVPNVLFVIAGEGPARAALRRQVADEGLADNVLFVGYLDRRTELRDCYRAADVFVFASRTETQGLVLLESLALGLPVVSTAVLGTKEVLAGAAGAIVVEEDVREFAAAVTRVLTQPDVRATLAAAGRGFVAARWSSGEMARRLVRLYADVCSVNAAVGRAAARADAAARASEERLRDPSGP